MLLQVTDCRLTREPNTYTTKVTSVYHLIFLACVCFVQQPKPSIPVQHPPPDADDYMLDVLATVEQKLVRLVEEMDGRDIEQLLNEMEDMQVGSDKRSWNFDWLPHPHPKSPPRPPPPPLNTKKFKSAGVLAITHPI